MYILAIIVSYVAGIVCGGLLASLVLVRKANKLERYQESLDQYQIDLDKKKFMKE